MKKTFILFLFFLFSSSLRSYAQNWFRDMYDPSVNFFTVQEEFNQWWVLHKTEVLSDPDGEGPASLYREWEYSMLPRMYARHGVRNGPFDSAEYRVNLSTMRRASAVLRGANPSNWYYEGPQASFQDYHTQNCKGRLNCIRFDPVDTAIMYAGAPGGGVWRTENHGQSWTLMNTDFLATLGVSDIAINPLNPSRIFTASGDYPNSDSYCLGVYQSMDAGQTWQTTGLSFTSSQGRYISRLLIDPTDTNILMAATNDTIYRSVNAGISWSRIPVKGAGRGMLFKPGDPAVMYVYGKKIYKSVDTGLVWTEIIDNAIDSGAVEALALAVTPAAPNNLYVSAADTSGDYMALTISDNMGTTFHARAKPYPTVGQAWYDLTLAVSPVDTNYMVAGDVGTYYSVTGGSSWHQPQTAPHVDQHDYEFYPHSNIVFSCDDGGLFISPDTFLTWTGIDSGLNIGELYNVSSSGQTADLVLTCRQDDAQKLLLNTVPYANVGTLLADGTNCRIDPVNDSIMYFSRQYGYILKTTDGGYTFDSIVEVLGTGVNSGGSWVTPFSINPQNHNSLYIAKDSIYKSADGGITWHALNFPAFSGTLYCSLCIAPGDSNVIYAATYQGAAYALYRSLDGGNTYGNITGTLAPPFGDIAVSYNDPGRLWLAGNGLYHSIDSGSTWALDTIGLPQFYYTRCLAVMNTPTDPLYMGVWWGDNIYYTNNTMNGWIAYNNGLPNVRIRQLEISEKDNVIRAATYGRDVWASPLYDQFPSGIATPPLTTASLNVWPNPNSGDFNIALLGNEEGPVTIRLYDILGDIVYKANADKGAEGFTYTVTANDITTGIYLVSVSMAGSILTQRLVVSR